MDVKKCGCRILQAIILRIMITILLLVKQKCNLRPPVLDFNLMELYTTWNRKITPERVVKRMRAKHLVNSKAKSGQQVVEQTQL
jgi:hypothetical protein